MALSAAVMLSCARVPLPVPPPPVARCPVLPPTAAPPPVPEHAWSRAYGDQGRQEATSIAVDGAGNAYVVGTFEHSFVDAGGGLLRARSRWPVFVQKLDPDGGLVWARSFGGEDGISRARVVSTGSSGNVIVVGSTIASSIDFGGGPLRNAAPGTNDVFVVALSPDGEHVWSRIFGGPGDEWVAPRALAVDASDGVHVAFRSNSAALDLGAGPVANFGRPGTDDVVLLKLDRNGALLWSSRFGGMGDERPEAIATSARGQVYVAAEVRRAAAHGTGSRHHVWLLAVDSSGREAWSKEIEGATVASVAAGCDDELFVTGIVRPPPPPGQPIVRDVAQIYLAAFARDGSALWSARYGTDAHEQPWDLVVDPCGDLVLTGDYGTPPIDLGGGPLLAGEGVMIFLAGFDRTGAPLWSRGLRGTVTNVRRTLALSPAGDLWLTGALWGSEIDLGGGPLVHRGLGDVVLARYAWRSRCGR